MIVRDARQTDPSAAPTDGLRWTGKFGCSALEATDGAADLAEASEPSAPTISGTVTIGGTLTITPGAGGGPVAGNRLYADGVRIRSIATGDAWRASDVAYGRVLTVRAYNAADESADSNALTWAPAALRYAPSPNALTPSLLAAWVDALSGLSLAQATGSKQPTASQTSLGGSPGVAFSTNDWMSALCALFTADQGVRIIWPLADVTDVFGFLLNLGVNYGSAGSFTLGVHFTGANQLVGGANGNGTSARAVVFDVIPIPAGGAVLEICLDTATTATGIAWARLDASARSISAALAGPTAAGNFVNAALTMGASDSSGNFPADRLTSGAPHILGGTADDADVADARASAWNLSGWTSRAKARVMPCGDSLVFGLKSGGGSIGGWRTTANAWLCDCTFVGPYTNVGKHRGVSGEKIQTVAADTATFLGEIASNTPDAMIWGWGVNDMITAGRTAVQVLADYDTLYTALRGVYPTMPVLITQCEVPTDGAHDLTQIAAFNAALPAWVAARPHMYQCTTPDGPYYDGLHKTPEGYRLTGRAYGAAAATMLVAEGF